MNAAQTILLAPTPPSWVDHAVEQWRTLLIDHANCEKKAPRVLGSDDIAFDVTWTGLNGKADETRSYNALSELAWEGGMSRVYGGIHFQFEITGSAQSCQKVADYVYDHYMRSRL